jgi:hypothetical protein
MAGMPPPPRRHRPPLTVLVAFRAEAAVADRLDALAGALSTRLHTATRSDVARVAVELGVTQLEEEARERQGKQDQEE